MTTIVTETFFLPKEVEQVHAHVPGELVVILVGLYFMIGGAE